VENLTAAEAEVKQGNPKSFVAIDAEFHEILARACGNKRFLELCQMLRRHMLRYRIESIFCKENVFRAIKGHRVIVACIKRKNEDGIDMAIRRHLDQSKRDIQRYAFGEDQEMDNPLRGKNA
jgi:DNA-binding GntR family transcriptional regulator